MLFFLPVFGFWHRFAPPPKIGTAQPHTPHKQMQPQPFPLAQIGAMADKQNLACIAGTIKSVWQAKKGENTNGQWSIQNAILVGTDGTEINLWLKDRDELPQSAKGRFVILTAKQSDKGLSGLYVMDDDFKGTITRKIKVTQSAEIAYSESGSTQPATQASAATTQASAATTQASAATTQKPAANTDPLDDARRTVLQITNLHLLCANAVAKYEAPAFKAHTGYDMSESQMQGATASIFIESCKSGLHRQMPASRMAL